MSFHFSPHNLKKSILLSFNPKAIFNRLQFINIQFVKDDLASLDTKNNVTMKVSIQKSSKNTNKFSQNVTIDKQAKKVKGGTAIVVDLCDF